VIFLTGVGVSRETETAIAECVRRGALCVAWRSLAPETVRRQCDEQGIRADGKGRWLVTEDFLSPAVRQMVAHVIPADNVIRYRFGQEEVVIRQVSGDLDDIDVTVSRVE
jgi:hypothetical protein